MRTALLFLLPPLAFAQSWVLCESGSTASLRGVGVLDGHVVWASGTAGTVLRTTDGGVSWQTIPVPGTTALDFRGIEALGDRNALAMASGEGEKSGIYTIGEVATAVAKLYPNPDGKGFFDAIKFFDGSPGMVLGDPVEGMFTLFRMDVHGAPLARVKLPPALSGEGAFAASNSSLVLRGTNVWFATGGASAARVFHSRDGGEHWAVATTPVRAGAEGAGIFSLAFADDRRGIAVGGDFKSPKEDVHNVALTFDGGATWKEPTGTRPRGYRSSVAWMPEHKFWIATGPTGSEISRDGGNNWIPFDDGAFNAIGVGAGDVCFAVGPKGRIARLDLAAQGKP